MMFVTTTNEKAVVAERVGDELAHITPTPPGLRILDAGMGDATVLSQLMRRTHESFPHVPWLIAGKEISIEDVRRTLERLPDRFYEHPEMVFVVTNMHYREAPDLWPADAAAAADLVWREVPLEGTTTRRFSEQIRALYPTLAADWEVYSSPKTGNPLYRRPAVLVLYRKDREFPLRPLIPKRGDTARRYDLVVASHVYRAKTPLAAKVRTVVGPLVHAIAPGGRLIAVHAHGNDPGLEIIRGVWPDEEPFIHDRHDIVAEARRRIDDPALHYPTLTDEEAIFSYDLHAMPSEAQEHIGTSSILATWNAAVYVAQIDEARLSEALASGAYVDATRAVIQRYGKVWFNDEAYIIERRR